MTPCYCGKSVWIRAIRKKGPIASVANWIEHRDGTPVCGEKKYEITAVKPYPPGPTPYKRLEDIWENDQTREAA